MISTRKKDTVEVHEVEMEGAKKSLILGAQATLQAVYECPDCPEPVRQALSGWVSWQERIGTTVERAIRSPKQAPQWVAALLALGAKVTFLEDEIDESGLADYLARVNSKRGKLGGVRLPLEVPERVWGEAHVVRTPADEPIVAAIAVVDLDSNVVRRARLGLTGVWREAARLAEAAQMLVGGPLTEERIQPVIAALDGEIDPKNDFLGSDTYRRAMAGVVARRALEDCMKGVSER
ncbi:MAG: hypothetical protein KAT23_06380 [Anaerolineales bacterium]|nr:hypothetical protein [Anaerolineales bacterium]